MTKINGSLRLIVGFCLFMCHLNASGKEHRWTHFGLRPLGMGNAYVAVADDYNALFYNPAGLARLKEWDGEFLNPALESAQRTMKFISDLVGLAQNKSQSLGDVLKLFREQSGKYHHMALYTTPHLIFPHFGLGIGFSTSASLVTHSNINIEFDSGIRLVAPMSFAMNFMGNKLSLGATAKFLSRAGINHSFTMETLNAFTNNQTDDLIEAGYGVGMDFGLLFTPIEPMKPTIGISVTDAGGSSYSEAAQGTARTPEIRLPSVNTGFSFRPVESDRTYLLVAVDAHMINQPIHYSHKLNLGVEWGFSDIIKIQGGLKEGYFTSGFQFDVGLLNLRFTTYAVDHAPLVGTHDSLVERRYALQVKLLI